MGVASKDIYVDKDDKITTDMSKAAAQIAVAGHVLDDRVVKRYGIADVLVSVDEPRARRMVKGPPIEEPEAAPVAEEPEAAEAADAASPEEVKPETEAKQPAAKKGAKKK